MCRVLGVSPSGYYAWRGRPPSRRARENEALSRRITAIHAKSREIYGARRVHAELWAAGVAVSRQRVARLMRALGPQGVTRRRRRCTTRRDREAAVAPDRVQRRFEAAKPNQVWVADITYVPTQEGFLYLATVLDVFSRKVVGWAMSARQTVELVQSALEMALETRAARGVVFHSDRGCQYTALAFSQRCAEAGIQQSMGRVGSCFDNAMAESLFATVECELLQRTPFKSRQQAQGEIFKFLEGFYNRRRRHSALGYLSPVEFERAWSAAQPPFRPDNAFRRALLAARFRRRRALLRHLFAGRVPRGGPGRLPGSRWSPSSPSSPRFHCLLLDFSVPLRHHGATHL